jgi:hypothetical protein
MRWLLLALLAGCTASEPPSLCEDDPQVVFGHGQASDVTRLAVALGGTAKVELTCEAFGIPPFDLPSIATTDSGLVASVDNDGATLAIHGLQDGTTTVSVKSDDGATTYGSLEVDVEAIGHLALQSEYDDIPPNVDVAFAAQFGTIAAVALAAGDGDVLADDDMTVTFPPGAMVMSYAPGTFDTTSIALGTYTLEVDSGGSAYTTDFVMVDHADSIALVEPGVTIPADGSPTDIDFAATLDGRFVAGLLWSYGLEGSGVGGANDDMISSSEDTNGDGAVSISARAGSATTTVSIPIQ